MEATVLRRNEGERIGGPTTVTIKATGEETGGSFYLGEAVVGPGFPGPPPHVHEHLHDMLYVLGGTLTIAYRRRDDRAGGRQLRLCAAGSGAHLQQSGWRIGSLLNFNTPR